MYKSQEIEFLNLSIMCNLIVTTYLGNGNLYKRKLFPTFIGEIEKKNQN